MKKMFVWWVILLLAAACSSGGSSGGGGTSGTAPTLHSVTLSPTSAPAYSWVNITVTITVSDPDGDLNDGRLVTYSVDEKEEAETKFSDSWEGLTRGTAVISSRFYTAERKVYTFQFWVIDRQGNKSNTITINFQLV